MYTHALELHDPVNNFYCVSMSQKFMRLKLPSKDIFTYKQLSNTVQYIYMIKIIYC